MAKSRKPPKFKRGDIVRRPDSWERRGKYSQGKSIVFASGSAKVVLCTFEPGRKIAADGYGNNPHIGHYATDGLTKIGRVKRMPKACQKVWTWKKDFYEQHPYFKKPRVLKAR